MAYEVRHSYQDIVEINYEGEALVLDFEFRGIPGLLWPLRELMEAWANQNGRLMELYIWQDPDPWLDRWRVYVMAHGTPVIALVAALPLLLTALRWLVIAFISWKASTIFIKSQQPTPGETVLGGMTPEQIATMTPEQIRALTTPAAPKPGSLGGVLGNIQGLGTLALLAFGLYLVSTYMQGRRA